MLRYTGPGGENQTVECFDVDATASILLGSVLLHTSSSIPPSKESLGLPAPHSREGEKKKKERITREVKVRDVCIQERKEDHKWCAA